MGDWLVGIITAVITSVLIYWLTEGINSNIRQRVTPEPVRSGSSLLDSILEGKIVTMTHLQDVPLEGLGLVI